MDDSQSGTMTPDLLYEGWVYSQQWQGTCKVKGVKKKKWSQGPWGARVKLKFQLNTVDKNQTSVIPNATWSNYLLLVFLPSITVFDKKTLIFLNELSLPDFQSLELKWSLCV